MVNFGALIGLSLPTPAPVELRYVEDVLTIVMANYYDTDLREVLLNDAWFEKFISNVYGWAVAKNKPLTTEQARIVLRALTKCKAVLIEREWATEAQVERLLDRPVYRNAPTQSSNVPREVRYLGDNLFGFRFKRNDIICDELKKMTDLNGQPIVQWDWMARLWIIPVVRSTIHPIMDIIRDHRFGFNDDMAEYLAIAINAEEEASTFVLDPNSGKIIATVNNHDIVAAWTASALKGEVL